MSMFCYQCQETFKNHGCTKAGMCGKQNDTANLQDLLIYVLKGISIYRIKSKQLSIEEDSEVEKFITDALFATITNVNFDNERFVSLIKDALQLMSKERENFLSAYKKKNSEEFNEELHDSAIWYSDNIDEFYKKAEEVGILDTEDEDVRSLRELLTYGIKGIAAYAHHAAILGFEEKEIYDFIIKALVSTTKDLSSDELVELVMEAGDIAVKVMALLDEAHTSTYGNPEITKVDIGVKDNPGILISGHDLKDMKELLEQTEDTGVDVYTHGEMLPAHYYPAFKKYEHLRGNYGGSWWKQNKEFASFNGPILMTTNCITPVKDSYRDRIFTTSIVGYPGVKHITEGQNGEKDFSEIIELAKSCAPPKEIETGEITGGFAHNQVEVLADRIVEAIKSGAIKRFIVMAGCDGRHKSREYFTEVAKNLPQDTVILTAGCAKYRYNKLNLGDIDSIPKVLDAGQCNDSYSLAVIALKLKEIFDLEDINSLPISFDIAWYEQKAVAVLLALLSLGVKGIRLGPTLPAFLSEAVTEVLVEKFDIKPVGEVEEDIKAMIAGK